MIFTRTHHSLASMVERNNQLDLSIVETVEFSENGDRLDLLIVGVSFFVMITSLLKMHL